MKNFNFFISSQMFKHEIEEKERGSGKAWIKKEKTPGYKCVYACLIYNFENVNFDKLKNYVYKWH